MEAVERAVPELTIVVPAQAGPVHKKGARRLVRIWLGAALLLVVTNQVSSLGSRFEYPRAWISAHFAVSARSFANVGVLALRGVPLVNTPPFGNPR
jgi:hypothetical protein